jgi:transposase
MTGDGQKLSTMKITNDSRLFDQYFAQYSNTPIRVTVESTRGVNWVIDYFQQRHVELIVSNPFLNRAIANVRCKNDSYDAGTLADLTRADLIARCHVPPMPIRELRELIAHRAKLVRLSTILKNKIHTVLSHYNHLAPYSDVFGTSGKEWISKLPMSSMHTMMVNETLDLLDALAPRILAHEKTITQRLHQHPYYRILQTIPGVGPLNAATIIARIDTIDRFNRHVEKFIKYAGLAVNTRSSADKMYLGKTNKRSDKFLRTAFVDAAITAVTKDPGLAQFSEYLTRIKGKGIARVAVARKLARSAFFILITGKPYKYRMLQSRYMNAMPVDRRADV